MVYYQDHAARTFQLELKISKYYQESKSVQDYYSGFVNMWTEFMELVYPTVPNEAISSLQRVCEVRQQDMFLMKLRRIWISPFQFDESSSCFLPIIGWMFRWEAPRRETFSNSSFHGTKTIIIYYLPLRSAIFMSLTMWSFFNIIFFFFFSTIFHHHPFSPFPYILISLTLLKPNSNLDWCMWVGTL